MTTEHINTGDIIDSISSFDNLGNYLAHVRFIRRMTLRGVEEASEKNVSNAYLSQLEKNKISKPSPNILHALSKVYAIPYESLMEKAGYISASTPNDDEQLEGKRHGSLATFSNENLTEEEQRALAAYLAVMRSQRG